jgi:hypothetical protein
MPSHPAGHTDLERQRARIEALFREGWTPQGPGRPQVQVQERLPFIRGVDEAEVSITGDGAWRRVAVLFCHQSFPGVRFGHRFAPGDKHAPIWLMEEIDTGALHRMMRAQPMPDDEGIVWTTWGANDKIGPATL